MLRGTSSFDIAQLDASFHLKALDRRVLLRAPLGTPDWNTQQKKLIRSYITGSRREHSGKKHAEELESALCRAFNVRYSIATSSGREAIKLILLSLGCEPGERIVMPAFCCPSVMYAVLELGLVPVFADVGEDLQVDPESVSRVIRHGDRVLIVPHLFGGLADIPALSAIARSHGTAVLDDAAQAIGRRGTRDWAGCGGDAGIFSFGLFKPLNATGGGAVLTGDENLYKKIRTHMNDIPCPEYGRGILLKKYLKSAWRKISFRPFLHNRLRRSEGGPGGISQARQKFQPVGISPLEAELALFQLQGMAAIRENAVIKARRFSRHLSRIPFLRVPGQGSLDGYPRFVVQIKGDDAPRLFYAELFRKLLHEGIEVQPTYRPLARIFREMGYEPHGEFQRSEGLAEKLLCLPLYPEHQSALVLKALTDIAEESFPVEYGSSSKDLSDDSNLQS